jgi:transposase-like protein
LQQNRFRRVEVLTGPGRRRKWSAAEKGRIVAETLEPGARVSEVARRWQVCPQQIFGWRRAALQELEASPEEPLSPPPQGFVPNFFQSKPCRRDGTRGYDRRRD